MPSTNPMDPNAESSSPPRSIASTAYDTAWVAALADPRDSSHSWFPRSYEWLLRNQLPDGSWGGALPYQPDRILSTLSAIVPLIRFGRADREHHAVKVAQRYVWQHAHELSRDSCELVGLELLLPTLARRVEQAGIKLPPCLDVYAEERVRKLALVPGDLVYSPSVTLVHSLEFLGSEGIPDKLIRAQGRNGSVGNSPAATAYLLEFGANTPALQYLQRCLAGDRDEAVPVLHPCETFDFIWSAYHRLLGGADGKHLLSPESMALLRAELENGGVSLSPSFPIPDADDTAVAMILLAAAGEAVSPAALVPFEKEGCYASFPYERHPSVGVNLHVLDAFVRTQPSTEPSAKKQRKILDFLCDARMSRTYWIDKWHISPFYATAHAILVLAKMTPPHDALAHELASRAMDWIRYTQNEDGSWGLCGEATSEETAYALLALNRAHELRRPSDQEMIRRGRAWLIDRGGATPVGAWPPMWIDKCLYAPAGIIATVVQAAIDSCAREC